MARNGAIDEGIVFLEYFRDLPDPRQAGKVVYPLDEIVLLCLLAVLAGAETFTDIAWFGTKKLDLLRRFRPFHDGTPAHDHLGDIFATLNAEKFQECFVAWVSAQSGAPADVIAIDGKTLRRSGDKRGAKAAIQMYPLRPNLTDGGSGSVVSECRYRVSERGDGHDEGREDHPQQGRSFGAGQAARQRQPSLPDHGVFPRAAFIGSRICTRRGAKQR